MKRHATKHLVFLLALGAAPFVGAQPAGADSSDHQLILQLMSRIQDLEAEVQRLSGNPAQNGCHGRVSEPCEGAAPPFALKQTSPGASSAESAAASRPTVAPLTANPAPNPTPESGGQGGAMAGMAPDMSVPGLPSLHVQGFSDIQYHSSGMPGDHSSFALGQFNLFITNRLSNKLSILGEVIMEADTHNAIEVDLERLIFQYAANDYFNLSAGRYHTGIGFYNTAFHHSTWLQSTVDRPFLFQFEDTGGILPIHNVGLSATGRIPSGELGLHYIAEIGNGRASRSPLDEAVQNKVDENNGKAVNLALYARPGGWPGFQAGFSVYRDSLHPVGSASIGETIFSGHAIYQSAGLEVLNEVVVLRHSVAGGRLFYIPAFYSQLSKRFGKFRPYFRYEYMNVPRGEPLFGDIGLLHGPIGGIRYDFSDFAAYKVEYFRDFTRSGDWNGLTTQVSFTF
jgi:hypothetical protein